MGIALVSEASLSILVDTTVRTATLTPYVGKFSHVRCEVSLPASGDSNRAYFTQDGGTPAVPTVTTTQSVSKSYLTSAALTFVPLRTGHSVFKMISDDAAGFEVRLTPVDYDERG